MKLLKASSKFHPDKIKYYYLLRSEPDSEPKTQVHLPDGTFELMFNYGHPIYQGDGLNGFVPRPDVVFMGGYKQYHQVLYAGNVNLIGVVFHPAFVAQVLKDRVNQSDGLCLSAELVFGDQVKSMADRLSSCSDVLMIRDLLDQFLSDLFHHHSKDRSEAIRFAYDQMMRHPAQIRVDQLADQACMSPRNFRRNFSETTGYAPREMLSIIRTKKLVHLIKRKTPVRQAAWELGYYDASHLLHDFRRISGTTPRDYVKNMSNIDLNFIRKSEYALLV